MTVPRVFRGACLLLAVLAAVTDATPARAEPDEDRSSFFSCRRQYASVGEAARSKGSIDFYHGLAYFGGAGGIRLWGSPSRRFTGRNEFDKELRGELSFSSTDARKDADLASDLTLAFTAGLLPAATIGASWLRTGDCVEAWEMFGQTVESFGLTVFLTEAVKLAAGRDRPYTERCGGPGRPPSDASCGSGDRHRSFWSGHASLAAAGAGVSCSFAIRRDAWGHSGAARATPCLLGGALALTTGVLRISADRHWGTDVLTGFAVGGVVGYFDMAGPLDLLRFETRDSAGRVSARGVVLPGVVEGRPGLQLIGFF